MNFGEAIERMVEDGRRCARKGWNGKGLWVRYVDLHKESSVSLDVDVWLPFLAMKTFEDRMVPWLASQADMLSEDWEIVT